MKEKELTLKEAEKIVDTMYQNRFVEAGVEEGNTIHLGNMDNIEFTDLESASIYLLREEIRLKEELQRKNNIINKTMDHIMSIFRDENWYENYEYDDLATALKDTLGILRGYKE